MLEGCTILLITSSVTIKNDHTVTTLTRPYYGNLTQDWLQKPWKDISGKFRDQYLIILRPWPITTRKKESSKPVTD